LTKYFGKLKYKCMEIKKVQKFITLFLIFYTVLILNFSPTLIFAASQTNINILLQSLFNFLHQYLSQPSSQQTQPTQPPETWCYDFNKNLWLGMRGDEVAALHTALSKEGFGDYLKRKYFGKGTLLAVKAFQEKYKDEILTPLGLKYATGFVGKTTRAKLNSLYGCKKPIKCPQVITPAMNPETGECKEFSTPCDIPVGWQRVEKCEITQPKPPTEFPTSTQEQPIKCPQVITPAKNPQTGECKEFPTPCDVPAGWQRVDKCEKYLEKEYFDIVIAGAGPGGIAAALQAARMGSKVLLLEETDIIGGQMIAAGVTSMDIMDRRWASGIYKEFENKIIEYYKQRNKSVGTCYWNDNSVCFEPSVGHRVLQQMIEEEKNITLRLKTQIIKVLKENNKIVGVITSDGKEIKTKILIDATEYGDILPLAGANYRAGKGTNSSPQLDSCIQDITYVAVIKKYPQGIPEELKIKTPPPGYNKEIESLFAQIVAANGYNCCGKYPVNWPTHNAYRGMPDSSTNINSKASSPSSITKTAINLANDYPYQNDILEDPKLKIKFSEKLSVRYLEDLNYRGEQNCQAKLRTLQFLYYVQNVLKENWSVATDEIYGKSSYNIENLCENIPQELKTIEKYLPPIPYVRESRRLIGLETLTAKDIKRENILGVNQTREKFSSSIAVGDYATDLHDCNDESDLEPFESINDATPFSLAGPFQVPIGVLISNNVDGLLAAEKNISVSRLANGATRLQPIAMSIGQAAGALAALSVKLNLSPKDVPVLEVQKALIKAKSILYPFYDVPPESPLFEVVQEIALRNIMIGYGNLHFGPNDFFPRKHLAIALTRAAQLPLKPVEGIFADVNREDPTAPYIEAVYRVGFVTGCSINPRKYCPDRNTTRAEAATVLLRLWQYFDPSISMITPSTPTYSDLPPTHWAYSFAESLAQRRIFMYCDQQNKKFCPDQPITRGEFAKLLLNILDKIPQSNLSTRTFIEKILSFLNNPTSLLASLISIISNFFTLFK
jgi:uncharacterized protein YbdZ (MbtH family)